MLSFYSKKFSDQEVIDGLREGDVKLEDSILKYLYSSNYNMVSRFIQTKGGSDLEAKDIFQDTIIVFYENVKADRFELNAKISTYLHTIARNKWSNWVKRRSRVESHEEIKEQPDTAQPIDHILQKEKNNRVNQLMSTLKEDCRKILTLSIYNEIPMKKISEMMGYQNEQIARNKKYKCLNYLKKQFSNNRIL